MAIRFSRRIRITLIVGLSAIAVAAAVPRHRLIVDDERPSRAFLRGSFLRDVARGPVIPGPSAGSVFVEFDERWRRGRAESDWALERDLGLIEVGVPGADAAAFEAYLEEERQAFEEQLERSRAEVERLFDEGTFEWRVDEHRLRVELMSIAVLTLVITGIVGLTGGIREDPSAGEPRDERRGAA